MKIRISGRLILHIAAVLLTFVAPFDLAAQSVSPAPGQSNTSVPSQLNNQTNAPSASSNPVQPTTLLPSTQGTTPSQAAVPDSFREIRLGMTLDEVKNALEKDPYFNYRGPPDVSMLASPDENLIETTGYSFISRAFFQFYEKKLYIMILMLNPSEISYYSMYTTLTAKYGPSSSLSPEEVVWESPQYRLSLERPLSVKYIDRTVFDRLKEAGKMKQSERSISRDQFLNQF